MNENKSKEIGSKKTEEKTSEIVGVVTEREGNEIKDMELNPVSVNVDKKKKSVPIVPIYGIDTFIEENVYIRQHRIAGKSFKVWYTLKKKRSLHEKMTLKEWETLFNKFLKEKTE